MSVKFLVAVGLMLGLGLVAAEVQGADKSYVCVVKTSAGEVLKDDSKAVMVHLASDYYVTAAGAAAAQAIAIAEANKQHNNRAATATCTEQVDRKNMLE